MLPVAWRMVNDSLRTDVSLLYPPYQIALACIHMACVVLSKDTKSWFAELHVDLDRVQVSFEKEHSLWKISSFEMFEFVQLILRTRMTKFRSTKTKKCQFYIF